MTWRRYLPPVPVHSGYPKGWVLLSDCLLNMPVCLFCEMVNVCYKIEGLEDVLEHPQKRFYPVINLPFSLTQQLLHSKKYVQSFSTLCYYMAEMGLLSFGREVLKEKDQMFIYLHKNASLLDTKLSLKGYNKTNAPEGHVFQEKQFHFDTLSDLQTYWEILQITAVNSNLGCKSMVHKDLEDEVTFEVKSLKQASAAYNPETVKDVGVLPGDRRGGAGLDSSLFSHTMKNWSNSGVLKPHRKYRKLSIAVGLKGGLDLESKREVVDFFNKNRQKGKERPDDPKKPSVVKKITREVSGNKGGKGILRRVHTEFTKTHKIISRMEGKIMKKRCIKIQEKVKKKKKPYEKGDAKDKDIYRDRCKLRVVWSLKEDSVLLMCRLATLIMDNKKKTALVSYIRIRDYLHEKCGTIAYDKTSQAVQRRIKFVLKNPQTEANLLVYYREAMQDEFVLTNYVSKEFVLTDTDLEPKFRKLVEYLLDKFKSLDLQKCCLPDTLEDLRQNYSIQYIGKLQPRKVYHDVKNKTEICQDVLRNILHSAVLLQDKQGRTHEMFKLLSQYPDALLSAVVRELRTDGLFVINKKNSQRDSVNQLQAGMGLRNFKVAQRYLYQFKHKYLSVMFEESAKLISELSDKHIHGEGDDEMFTLPFHPKSGECAALFPLILNRRLDLKITMPQELVIVDMEGFYKFPWGRGKNSSSQTKGDKILQEIKHPESSRDKLSECSAEQSKEDENAEKDTNGKVSKLSNTDDKVENNAMDIEDETNTTSQTDQEVNKETVDKPASKKCSKEIPKDKEEHETDLSGPSTSSTKVTGDSDKLKGVEKSESNVSTGSTHISTNHSTVVIPDLDQAHQTSDALPGTVAGIASRTLLSLRRAEDCTCDDIRIFNAQDNFVVNACDIGIKIRKDQEEGKGGNPLLTKVSAGEDKTKHTAKGSHISNQILTDKTAVDEVDERTEEKLMKERMDNVSKLLLDKTRIKDIYTNLQKLLPFQIDIQQVWASIKDQGASEEDLKLYKKVYSAIDSHGEIGVRCYDLKKEFVSGTPWREALDILIHQNAVCIISPRFTYTFLFLSPCVSSYFIYVVHISVS
ncbi:general transcription factor 3C polypeptide 1-like [Ruditapes philippinarum]|uniref:general transcription factor 3C polypeptide 1-like n=1 Tax=Ruditapes philippinarum TaxID=129788 RepID=UPI00295AA17D|nr:general transcription factor 3C polypeptide 1-like [Ruditapes philippinarum]